MWFSGFFFRFCLTVEGYLWWKLQISSFFVSGKTRKIGSVSNTYLPHCIYQRLQKINTKTVLIFGPDGFDEG